MSRTDPLRMLSAAVVGLAFALWLFPVLAGPKVQRLRLEHDRAVAENESLRNEVSRLKEAAEQRQGRPVVKRVKATVDGPDQRVSLAAEKKLERELSPQVGRPIDDTDPVLLYSRLHGRLILIDGILYYLEVRLLAVGAELRLYGMLRPVREE